MPHEDAIVRDSRGADARRTLQPADRDGRLRGTRKPASTGFIQAAPQDRTNLPQAALGVTRFRVTFTRPGVFNYICALHDELGMVGKVIVLK